MRKAERACFTNKLEINKDNSNILLNLNDVIVTDTSVTAHFNNFFTTIREPLSNNKHNI